VNNVCDSTAKKAGCHAYPKRYRAVEALLENGSRLANAIVPEVREVSFRAPSGITWFFLGASTLP
jgi:hypothetical protein